MSRSTRGAIRATAGQGKRVTNERGSDRARYHTAETAAALAPHVAHLSLSHEINPEAREYERASSTAFNAAAMPIAATYLSELEQRLPLGPGLQVFHSAGAMVPLAGNRPLVQALQTHGQAVFGEPIPALGTPLYTDVRLYVERGIPGVIYGAGPRTVLESHAKRADERLNLNDLRRATQVMARVLADLLA